MTQIFTNQATDANQTFDDNGHEYYVQVWGTMDGATLTIQTRLDNGADWADVVSLSSTGISRIKLPPLAQTERRASLTGTGASSSVSAAIFADSTRIRYS